MRTTLQDGTRGPHLALEINIVTHDYINQIIIKLKK